MFMTTTEYLQRITHAIEHVIVPQIESDFLRGQLLASVFLLDQLTDRIEYKADFIGVEEDLSRDTMKKIVTVMEEKGIRTPDDIRTFIQVHDGACEKTLEFRDRCDEMFCTLIKFFFAHKEKLDEDVAHEIEGLIIEYCSTINSRDLGVFKMSTSQQLIQTKD